MITRETVDKLRADRRALLDSVDALARHAMPEASMRHEAEHLSEQLRAYTGLVEAVLDAVSVDPALRGG